MNRTVDCQSGPFMIADATWPSQSSPAVMEKPLCSLNGASFPPGVMIEKLGRFPRSASRTNDELGDVVRLLAGVQAFGERGADVPDVPGGLSSAGVWLAAHRRCATTGRALPSRSRIVGAGLTGVGSNAPPFCSPRSSRECSSAPTGRRPCPDPLGDLVGVTAPSRARRDPLVRLGVVPSKPSSGPSPRTGGRPRTGCRPWRTCGR